MNLKLNTKYYKMLCQKGHTSKECIKMIINIYSVNLNLLTSKYSTHLSIPALITFFVKTAIGIYFLNYCFLRGDLK